MSLRTTLPKPTVAGLGCLSALMLWAFCTAPAAAFDDNGRFSVRGMGALKCSEAIQMVAKGGPEVVALVAWSEGALSATNRYRKGVFDALPFKDPPGVFTTLVLNYCKQKPADIYDSALAAVIDILKPASLDRDGKAVEVSAGGAKTVIYPETLKKAQAKLIKRGLLTGKADGKFGEGTRAALVAFQKSKGKKETGLPDAETVLTLLLEG